VEATDNLTALRLDDASLPSACLHRSYMCNYTDILRFGLLAGGPCGQSLRNYVHFDDTESAEHAPRFNCDLAIWIDMRRAMVDGMAFYRSKNGVILSQGIDGTVPSLYIVKAQCLQAQTELELRGRGNIVDHAALAAWRQVKLECIVAELFELYFGDRYLEFPYFGMMEHNDGWLELQVVTNFDRFQALNIAGDLDFVRKIINSGKNIELSSDGLWIRKRQQNLIQGLCLQ